MNIVYFFIYRRSIVISLSKVLQFSMYKSYTFFFPFHQTYPQVSDIFGLKRSQFLTFHCQCIEIQLTFIYRSYILEPCLIKINKIQNLEAQPHQSHFKCTVATCICLVATVLDEHRENICNISESIPGEDHSSFQGNRNVVQKKLTPLPPPSFIERSPSCLLADLVWMLVPSPF